MTRRCRNCGGEVYWLTNFDAVKCKACGWVQTGLDDHLDRPTNQEEARAAIQAWIDEG